MEDLKWLLKKYGLLILLMLVVLVTICLIYAKKDSAIPKNIEGGEQKEGQIESEENKETSDTYAKGYNLPVEEASEKEADSDCISVMKKIKSIYQSTNTGDSLNPVISQEAAEKMMEILKETGESVSASAFFINMCNYEKVQSFLEGALRGEKGEVIIYNLRSDGGVGRKKITFDGADMYVLDTGAIWNEEKEPIMTGTFYNRIKEWRYTEKGWFIYEYCVPEPPEVSEVIYGNAMIRVKPLKEKYIEIVRNYLLPIGYQGNNLFCSNWDINHLENIDYTGLYEYLYAVKYQKLFNSENYDYGIPKEGFESLIMEYLPVTAEELRKYAVFDSEHQAYKWVMLGCGNYSPNTFGISVPEIADMEENEDGTVTLTIDAVCEMEGSDAIMSHKLTVRFQEEGSIQYLSNQVLGDGLNMIPEYQYRLGKAK